MFYHFYSTRCSPDGTYEAVNYSDTVRASYLQVPVKDVHNVYRALKTFSNEIHSEENKIEIKLCPGTVVSTYVFWGFKRKIFLVCVCVGGGCLFV